MVDDISRLELTVGRYLLFGVIGSGGMATVHLGRRVGAAGFSRLVAIKRLHPHLGKQREFVHSFLDEARIAARVSHPNVVSIDDVVMDGPEVLLVMEYIHGRALSSLMHVVRDRGDVVPPSIATAIALDMLHGLQAAHEARDERGRLLGLVHRDVSPQNVLVGVDGVARVLDFGIAKALGRLQTTEHGSIKGKLAYMAPERLVETEVTTSVDIYGAAIVFWEMLTGERYFKDASAEGLMAQVLAPIYRHLRDPALTELDAILARALHRQAEVRHASCNELTKAIEGTIDAASRGDMMAWIQDVAGVAIAESAEAIEEIERSSVRSARSAPQQAAPPTGREGIVAPSEPPSTEPDPAPTLARSEPPSTRREGPLARGDLSPAPHEQVGSLTSDPVVTPVQPSIPHAIAATTRERRLPRLGTLAIAAGGLVALLAIAIGGLAQSRSRSASASTAAPMSPMGIAPTTSVSSTTAAPSGLASSSSPPSEASSTTSPAASIRRGPGRTPPTPNGKPSHAILDAPAPPTPTKPPEPPKPPSPPKPAPPDPDAPSDRK